METSPEATHMGPASTRDVANAVALRHVGNTNIPEDAAGSRTVSPFVGKGADRTS